MTTDSSQSAGPLARPCPPALRRDRGRVRLRRRRVGDRLARAARGAVIERGREVTTGAFPSRFRICATKCRSPATRLDGLSHPACTMCVWRRHARAGGARSGGARGQCRRGARPDARVFADRCGPVRSPGGLLEEAMPARGAAASSARPEAQSCRSSKRSMRQGQPSVSRDRARGGRRLPTPSIRPAIAQAACTAVAIAALAATSGPRTRSH